MTVMNSDKNSEMQGLYGSQPLCEEAILSRVLEHRGSLRNLCELDLAWDATVVTDQDHVGGMNFTLALAQAARFNSATRLIDLACGLGGSARALAFFYGCSVHGIDKSSRRIEEAIDLTSRVGLSVCASFQAGDVMNMDPPDRRFDVLWGQSSWSQFYDKNRFLGRWAEVLAPSGTIALEDMYLKRPPQSRQESLRLAALENASSNYFVSEREWTHILWRQKFEIAHREDLTPELARECAIASIPGRRDALSPSAKLEADKSRMILELVNADVLGYFRLVADQR
ncbi:MAG: methyltransferase domain-containing protein [Candidatus Acidiferrales bacterium]